VLATDNLQSQGVEVGRNGWWTSMSARLRKIDGVWMASERPTAPGTCGGKLGDDYLAGRISEFRRGLNSDQNFLVLWFHRSSRRMDLSEAKNGENMRKPMDLSPTVSPLSCLSRRGTLMNDPMGQGEVVPRLARLTTSSRLLSGLLGRGHRELGDPATPCRMGLDSVR
jgi:hypothetical protein